MRLLQAGGRRRGYLNGLSEPWRMNEEQSWRFRRGRMSKVGRYENAMEIYKIIQHNKLMHAYLGG